MKKAPRGLGALGELLDQAAEFYTASFIENGRRDEPIRGMSCLPQPIRQNVRFGPIADIVPALYSIGVCKIPR
jgi:hypothetical protein